jgi:ribosomal protein L11 methylase PrmA
MRFDCVVANVNSATIVELAPGIVAAVKGGGIRHHRGIARARRRLSSQLCNGRGARIAATVADGSWRTLVSKAK